MMVYSKETRNEAGKFYREEDWGIEVYDDFSKSNFTTVKPPIGQKCDWNEATQSWDIDTSIDQSELDAMTTVSKLETRRAFRALGQEATLDALLASNAIFKADWQDAVEVDLSDPVLIQALDGSGIDVNEIKRQILSM